MSAAQDLAEARRRCGQVDPFLQIQNGDDLHCIDLRSFCMVELRGEEAVFTASPDVRLYVSGLLLRDGGFDPDADREALLALIERWKAVRQ